MNFSSYRYQLWNFINDCLILLSWKREKTSVEFQRSSRSLCKWKKTYCFPEASNCRVLFLESRGDATNLGMCYSTSRGNVRYYKNNLEREGKTLKGYAQCKHFQNVLDSSQKFIFGEQFYCIEPFYISRYVHKAPMLFKSFLGVNSANLPAEQKRRDPLAFWQIQLHHTSAVYTESWRTKNTGYF